MPCFEDTGEKDYRADLGPKDAPGRTVESSGKMRCQDEASSRYQGSSSATVGQENCEPQGETRGLEGPRAAKSLALRFSNRR